MRIRSLLKMPADATMSFYIQNWSTYRFEKIGSVGSTVWSVRMNYGRYAYSRWSDNSSPKLKTDNYEFEISRSIDNARVEITIDVRIGGNCLMTKNNVILNERQTETRFLFNRFKAKNFDKSLPLTGYVRVCCCKTEVCTQTEKVKQRKSLIEDNPTTSPQLASDIFHLLGNPDSFSDATLVCGTTKFLVHRNILSTRSPVFAAMFKTQMQEGRDGVVDIVDMEPDVLQAMLRYVYSGKTDHLTHSLAEDLLFGADKYQLEELKLVCVELLKGSIAESNVFRSLVLGDLHDDSLKAHTVEFICKYNDFSDLEKTEEWQSLVKERPSLALEVTTNSVKYLQSKLGSTKNISIRK